MSSPWRPSPWPHRLAVALALVTFPLIWVGGLVTTYDAGMAVPDWPGTYGYNVLLYPWQTWIYGPWDLFIEHKHRLLATTTGLVTIALLVVVVLTDRRRWLLAAASGALALVIFQGALGGARVLLDDRLVALLHACIGPLFFAYVGALAVSTSRWWNETSPVESPAGQRLLRAAAFVAGLAYVQLVLGAVLRHVPLTASPQVFRAALVLHLLVAGVLTAQIVVAAWRAWVCRAHRGLVAPGLLLPLLVAVQIGLGLATYVAKYSWPAWLGEYAFAASYVVQEKSLAQSLITTGHVALGSLILFTAVVLATRCLRWFAPKAATSGRGSSLLQITATNLAIQTATTGRGFEGRAA
jgi:cytochrome c oxidase assembly protein subunit 15